MTIFHVIKYPPREIMDKWGTHAFSRLHTLVPVDVADSFMDCLAIGKVKFEDGVSALEKILLNYEGPL